MRILKLSLCLILLHATQTCAVRACKDDIALLAADANFHQLVERVLGPEVRERLVGSSHKLALTASDIDGLFKDTNDPWMQRMGTYLLNGVRSGDLTVDFTADKQTTGYAAGTCWNGGCGTHIIYVLLDSHLMGSNPARNGIRVAVRATLIHEAMHARIHDYLERWLERQALDPQVWHRRLVTATEEYMARIADQRAIGRIGMNAKLFAWFSTLIDAGQVVNPWTRLEAAWTRKLKEAGVNMDNREQRVAELAAQREDERQVRALQRGWTLQEVQGLPPIKELRALLIEQAKISEAQWTRFENAVTEELHSQWGKYAMAELAQAVERHAQTDLGVVIKGDYSPNIIFGFEIQP